MSRLRKPRRSPVAADADGKQSEASSTNTSTKSLCDTIVIPAPEDKDPTPLSSDASPSEQPLINRSSLRQRRHGKAVRPADEQPATQAPGRDKVVRSRCKPTKRSTPLTLTRLKDLAGLELSRVEDAQERADLQAKWRRRALNSPTQTEGSEESSQLSRVPSNDGSWGTNEEEITKSHGGIRYERKIQGPFTGNFVSPGSLITIDGEDHVEYRVLAKLR
ncbi:hypothetical protein FALBO_11321 [Fusarium albosuccineum]|uniref:Uncharacterized protein n=1 Tax=Fusarium albosuccineum TaxID=1237068 RepID=A0A8H4L4G0_9HYPO|nr:hypothetical protein FALBO_11321 [Fusarium albosuccineum]